MQDLELADDVLTQYRLEYGSIMDMESRLQSEKQKEKDVSSRADKLVASAGAGITCTKCCSQQKWAEQVSL